MKWMLGSIIYITTGTSSLRVSNWVWLVLEFDIKFFKERKNNHLLKWVNLNQYILSLALWRSERPVLGFGLVFGFLWERVNQNSSLGGEESWQLNKEKEKKMRFLFLFSATYFFNQSNKPAAHLTVFSFEWVELWKHWGSGSKGSLLKEWQLCLSWEMSMHTTEHMLCKDLQARRGFCLPADGMVVWEWKDVHGHSKTSFMQHGVIFSQRCLTKWPQALKCKLFFSFSFQRSKLCLICKWFV